MTAVQRFRDEAPRLDHARLTAGHRRFQAGITETRRRRRGGWQLAAVGAVASVVATALLSTLTMRQEEAASTRPESHAQRWVYQEVRWDTWQCGTGAGTDGYSEVGSFNLGPASPSCSARPAAPKYKHKWIRYNGSALATPDESTSDPDDVDVWQGNYQTGWELLPPEDSDDLVARLPADAAAALRLIRGHSVPTRFAGTLRLTQVQRDFADVVGVLATAPDLPPAKARTLHDVIMSLAGVTVPVRVTDGVGRAVLAIGVDGDFRDYSDQRNSMQVLLDPKTFAYRGVRYVAGLDYHVGGKSSGGPFVAKGTVLATATRVSTALVEKAGEHP
ncbi:hypothetical protein ACOT81_42350 [Streptomyces sp. WI04-05B]|uniref:hypothetical protein n=1 Tax=Streptomyces TaxID=1883 RepID=UPI0029A49FEE|nr:MULTISPECIES: hypothetical protein [unclassified Streptomyces]MDX2547820.1 hypothetical protein [Streptomyces sp. WI04-05B]MDX2583076.1 hypothetical protein [Streptomyces sp. WI04-05A]MDX3748591.1 hypothetical protein [Streptomyces sp. AK08-02]